MADYDITSPDGRKFRITAPEGATQEQVLGYAKEQFAKMPKEAPAAAPEQPSALRQAADIAQRFSPGNLVAEGLKGINDAAESAGYAAGGKVTDWTGSPGAGFATNVAIQAVPSLFGGAPAKAIGSPVMVDAAKRLMQSAVKPNAEALLTKSSIDPTKSKAAQAIQTMLDEGINATEGGMLKVRSEVNDLKGEVSKLIAQSPASVDKAKVANELFGVLDRVYKQASYKGDVKKVEAAFDEFMNHPLLRSNNIPVQLAQDMKKAGNRQLASDFGNMSGAEIEAQKSLVRGLKEGVADAVPAVKPLNARQSELLNVLKTAERRAMMEGNKNPAGLSLLAEGPNAAAAFMFDRSALAKSLLARGMYQGSGAIPAAAGGGLGALIGNRLGQPPTLEEFQRRNHK